VDRIESFAARFSKVWVVVFLLILACVLILNAWIVDDAYITFRTVENFVHGLGLTWNPGERVQVYTHPLWMLLVSFCYLVTSEFFFTVIVLSVVIALSAVFIAAAGATDGFRLARWKVPFLVLALISSKAVIDFSSSGLAHALSYLIAAVFLVIYLPLYWKRQEDQRKDVRGLFFLAALAFVNRYDVILLYLPALLHLLWISRSASRWKLMRDLLIGFSPAILWVLFSTFYYGSPFPNTAFAKEISTGFPFSWKALRGLEYLANSVLWDPASYFILLSCGWLAIKERTPQSLTTLTGIALYMIFIALSAASATHMSGRFLAVPFFMAVILLVTLADNPRSCLFVCVLFTAYILWSPVSAIKFGTPFYQAYAQNPSLIDAKWYVGNEGAALINWRPGKQMPDHVWFHDGELLREQAPIVHIGGSIGEVAIGYFGFAAGPGVYIIDQAGLSDPLLSRLPAVQPPDFHTWKSGHFFRLIPDGYVQSIANDRNMITNESLQKYYEAVRAVTRGPLLSLDRFRVIWDMNLGWYNYLIEDYVEQTKGY